MPTANIIWGAKQNRKLKAPFVVLFVDTGDEAILFIFIPSLCGAPWQKLLIMENGEFEKGTISDGTITVFVCATEERGEAFGVSLFR